jgi:hypothetical protein
MDYAPLTQMLATLPERAPVLIAVDAENMAKWVIGGDLKTCCGLLRARADLRHRLAFAADWSGRSRCRSELEREGFTLIACRNPHKPKQAADFRMTIDVVDAVRCDPALAAAVVVTGDADFLPLLTFLIGQARLAVTAIGYDLSFGPDVVAQGGWLVTEAKPGRLTSSGPVWDAAVEAVRDLLDRAGGEVELQHLGNGGRIDFKRFGFARLRGFLEASGIVRLAARDGRLFARLRASPGAPRATPAPAPVPVPAPVAPAPERPRRSGAAPEPTGPEWEAACHALAAILRQAGGTMDLGRLNQERAIHYKRFGFGRLRTFLRATGLVTITPHGEAWDVSLREPSRPATPGGPVAMDAPDLRERLFHVGSRAWYPTRVAARLRSAPGRRCEGESERMLRDALSAGS